MNIELTIINLWRQGKNTHEIAKSIDSLCYGAVRESTVYHVINDWLDRGHKQKKGAA